MIRPGDFPLSRWQKWIAARGLWSLVLGSCLTAHRRFVVGERLLKNETRTTRSFDLAADDAGGCSNDAPAQLPARQHRRSTGVVGGSLRPPDPRRRTFEQRGIVLSPNGAADYCPRAKPWDDRLYSKTSPEGAVPRADVAPLQGFRIRPMDTQGFALGCPITPRWGTFNLARAPPWYHDIPARLRRSEPLFPSTVSEKGRSLCLHMLFSCVQISLSD